MTRFANSGNTTASQQPHVNLVLFLDLDLVSGHQYLSSWDRAFTFGGNTYQPLGQLAGVDGINEEDGLASDRLTFTLAGIDTTIAATVLTEKYHGRSATLYMGFLDGTTQDLAATPEIIWEGRMDSMGIDSDANASTIKLICQNRLAIWNQTPGWMYTVEHQAKVDATDTFFGQVASLSQKIVKWGGGRVTNPSSGTDGYSSMQDAWRDYY